MTDYFNLIKIGAIVIVIIIVANQLGIFKAITEGWNKGVNDLIQSIIDNWFSILILTIIIVVIVYLLIHFGVIEAIVNAIQGIESSGA